MCNKSCRTDDTISVDLMGRAKNTSQVGPSRVLRSKISVGPCGAALLRRGLYLTE